MITVRKYGREKPQLMDARAMRVPVDSLSQKPLAFSMSLFPDGITSTSALVENFERELKLIKAAVLYADSVEVQSFALETLTSLLTLRDALEKNMSVDRSVLEALPRVALIFCDGAVVDSIIKKCKYLKKRKRFKKKEQHELRSTVERVVYGLTDIFDTIDFGELSSLNSSEFIVLREPVNSVNLNYLADKYLKSVLLAISDPAAFPYIDPKLADILFPNAELEGLGGGALVKRMRHTGLANSVLFTLPVISVGSIKAVLNLRNELSPYIEPFRVKIAEISADIESTPWEPDFAPEIDDKIRFEVLPAVREIHRAFAESSYVRSLYKRLALDPPAISRAGYLATVGGGAVDMLAMGGGLSNSAGLVSAVSACLSVGASSAVALNDFLEEKRILRQRDFYFLYAASR